ncbi:MAG: ElyC/SanA/YdcF family protein [Streptosporangiaceae bacterium]|jgi:hypothetical protein
MVFFARLLTPDELAGCAVVVEQKGDDPVECRERVLAGRALWEQLVPYAPSCQLAVVGGAGGDVPEAMIREWCAGSPADPVVRNESRNTHDKACSIEEFTRETGVTTVIQVSSLYHSLRAYLTTVKVLRDAGSPVTVLNHVCDSDDPSAVVFTLLDEIYLATGIEPELRFALEDDHYRLLTQAARSMTETAGHRTYLGRRYGEARRIAAYAEPGKGHLATDLTVKEILDSYPLTSRM